MEELNTKKEQTEEEMRLINIVNERNNSWVVEVNDQLSNMGSIPKTEQPINKKNSIYRRPVNISFLYTPHIVSFGPYHHDQQTNKSKKLVLVHCLNRSGKRVDDFLKVLSTEVVQDLKDAYDELKWQHDDDAFLKLMIYDGCFLLEILREEAERSDEKNRLGHIPRQEAERSDEKNNLGHFRCQALAVNGINRNKLMEYYKHDMLLLENQIPMRLLVNLYAVTDNLSIQEAEKALYKLILKFFAPSSPNIAEKMLTEGQKGMYLHALDLYRHSLLYQEHKGESTSDSDDESDVPRVVIYCAIILSLPIIIIIVPIAFVIGFIGGTVISLVQALRYLFRSKPPTDMYFIIPSATELDKVGIGLNMNKTKSLKDVSFQSRALWLPELYVDGATQSRFLNIIAFEQLHEDADKHVVTSYIYFMSRLLQAASDVRLLQLRGIIRTPLPNYQVAELFKSLTKDIVHNPNLVPDYCDMSKKLTGSFYSKMNNAWQRDLWQTYLKSPLAVISGVAAFSLFTLTSLQTAYTIFSYYNRT